MAKGARKLMEDLELELLTEDKVSYRYYPEGGKEYGIVSLDRKTGQRIHDKFCPDTISLYAGQAWRRLEKYQRENRFPEKDMIAWC